MGKTVSAFYSEASSADRAAKALTEAGFPREAIRISTAPEAAGGGAAEDLAAAAGHGLPSGALPQNEAQVFREELRKSSVQVAVTVADENTAEVRKILEGQAPLEIRERTAVGTPPPRKEKVRAAGRSESDQEAKSR